MSEREYIAACGRRGVEGAAPYSQLLTSNS